MWLPAIAFAGAARGVDRGQLWRARAILQRLVSEEEDAPAEIRRLASARAKPEEVLQDELGRPVLPLQPGSEPAASGDAVLEAASPARPAEPGPIVVPSSLADAAPMAVSISAESSAPQTPDDPVAAPWRP